MDSKHARSATPVWNDQARSRAIAAIVVWLATCLARGDAGATMIVPMSAEDLAASSEIVVVGVVEQIGYAELADGHIVTRIAIRVDESWKGSPGSPLQLIEPGGIVGGRGEMVYGVPSYQVDEDVLVYATRGQHGWQTNHMLQGKFRVATSGNGARVARRDIGVGVAVLASPARPWRSEIPLHQLRSITEATATTAAGGSGSTAPGELDVVAERSGIVNLFDFAPRFFPADLGQPLTFVIDDRGDDIIGFDAARRAVDDAMTAWNAVADTSLDILDGGLTDDIGPVNIAGVNRILFNDPNNEILPPANCSGTLGLAGPIFSVPSDDPPSLPTQQKTFNRRTFNRITSTKVTFANGWEGCAQWTECNVSEVAAHELGHAFGLGHSSEDDDETNQTLGDALMFKLAHHDGRCADPREYDIAAIRFLYPAAIPVSITTPDPLPEAIAGQPYSFALQAIGGQGGITFTRTGECQTFGLEVSAGGLIEGTLANVVGTSCIAVVATDSAGDTHRKRFAIDFVETASSPTPTADIVDSATPTRTPTETAPPDTPTPPAVRPCVGDCDGNGQLSINELIRGVNIALGRADLSGCPSFDRDGNGRVSINELIQAVQAALFGCTEA